MAFFEHFLALISAVLFRSDSFFHHLVSRLLQHSFAAFRLLGTNEATAMLTPTAHQSARGCDLPGHPCLRNRLSVTEYRIGTVLFCICRWRCSLNCSQ
uniref:Putative secreted protein n=1 Tax=Ixodes ricinus TaxID=34613 RepID=A0A6B0U7G4_IXORI